MNTHLVEKGLVEVKIVTEKEIASGRTRITCVRKYVVPYKLN